MLDGTGLEGNECVPELDLSEISDQQVTVGTTITLDLLSAGGTVVDLNEDGSETGDTITFVLDADVPDQTPTGATISTDGVFTWTPTEGQEGTYSIIVIAIDAGSPRLADSETFTITVLAESETPSVDLNGSDSGLDYAATFTEGGDAVAAVDADRLAITDADDTNIESATITLTNPSDGSSEVLAVDTTDTDITASYDDSTGVLTLSGSDTLASYQSVLRTLTYDNTSDDPTGGDRTIEVVVSDGDNTSAVATSTITVEVANEVPEVDLDGSTTEIDITVSFTEAAGAVSIVGADMTVTDADDDNLVSATITLTNLLDGTAELLAVDTTDTDITASYDDSTGVLTLTGSDTIANYQQVLRTLTYDNTSSDPTSTDRAVEIVVNDGEDDSAARTATVEITLVNDAPVLVEVSDTTAFVDEELEIEVTASDVDSGDTLTFTLDYNNSPASATITKTDDYTAVIRWTPGNDDANTTFGFAVVVSDDGTTVLTDSVSFDVTVGGARPTVDLNGDDSGTGFLVSYIENDLPSPLAEPDVTITTDSTTTIASATVTITNLEDGTAEVLAAVTDGTSITASYDSATGVLTLTGEDTIANYQTVLASLTYENTSEDPTVGDRDIVIVVNDGSLDSLAVTSTVTIFAINDYPELVIPSPYDDPDTPVEVTEFQTITFTVDVIDVDHGEGEFYFFLDTDNYPLPDDAVVATIGYYTGEVTWTPNLAGTYHFLVVVVDLEGGIDQQYIQFTVVEDTTAPTVTDAPTGTYVSPISALTVTFSEAMADTAFDVDNYSLIIVGGDNDGTVVDFSSLTIDSENSITLSLAADLALEDYELTLDNSLIDDLADNLLSGDFTFDFTVAES